MGGTEEGISTKVSVLGDKEYKQSMADVGRQLTVLNTEMTANTTAFGNQANSMEALQKKGGSLEKILQAQAEKVRLVAEQLNKAKEEYGENSKQADTLQIALNRAQTAFNKTATEVENNETAMAELTAAEKTASTATDSLSTSAEDAAKAVKEQGDAAEGAEKDNKGLKEALQKTGEVAGTVVVAGVKVAAAAIAALGAAAVAGVKSGFDFAVGASQMADDIMTLSAQTGISTENLQKWTYAQELTDVSVSTMTSSMAKMIKQMGSANNGLESSKEKFARLGVSIHDSSGKLRDSEDVFFDCVDALGKVGNETERDALAMELFGKKAQDLNPLIEVGGETLRKLGGEAEAAGAVFSGDALEAMGSFDDSMQRMKSTSKGLKDTIGLLLIPAFQPLVNKATASMATISAALKDGLQPGELETIMQSLVADISGAMEEVSEIAMQAIPVISELLGDAVGLMAAGMPKLINQLLPAAMKLLQAVVDGVVSNAKPLAEMASSLIANVVHFLIENAPGMVDAAAALLGGLIDGLLSGDGLAELVSGAIDMLAKLAVSLVENAFVLAAKAPEIVGQLIKGILGADWLTIGKDLLTSLAGGISSAFSDANKLAEAYKTQFGVTQEAYDAFKAGLEKADLHFESAKEDAEGKKALATELLELYSALETKEIKTDADLTLMATYAKQIAELYPSLGEYIDPTTGLFAENTTAILNNINAMAQLALVQGYQDYLNELGTTLAQANIDILKHTESLKAQYEEWKRLSGVKDDIAALYDTIFENRDGNGGLLAFNDNLTEVYNTIKEHAGIENPLAGFVDVLADGTVVLREGADAAAAYDAAQNQLTAAATSANGEFSALNGVYLENKTALEGMQTEAAATGEEMGSIAGLITKGTEAFNGMIPAAQNAGAAGKQAGEDMEAGAEAVLSGAGTIEVATGMLKGADTTASDVAEGVGAAGDSVAVAAGEILTTVENIKGAQTAAEAAKEAVSTAMTAVSDEAAAMLETMKAISAAITLTAEAMLEAIKTAITTGTNKVAEAGKTMAQKVVAAVSGEMTPAKGTTIGKDFTIGVGTGVTNNSTTVSNAAKALASSALTALRSAVGEKGSNFQPIGTAIADGVAAGIRNNAGVIATAARAAAKAAYDAAKKELGIASPSKRMYEIGEFYDEGFAGGIMGGMDKVLASARMLSNMAAEETAGGMAYPSMTQAQIDYAQLGEAVAAANTRAGLGHAQMFVDGRLVAETIEPAVSRAGYQRGSRSVAGRSARMVLV